MRLQGRGSLQFGVPLLNPDDTLLHPSKTKPRSSVIVAATAETVNTTNASQPSDKDKESRVAAITLSHSPAGKRTSVILPNSLEKAIVLKKGNAGLGLTVNADKSNGVMVKSIIRGGAVHHDGRLAVGDFITSVNTESMRGLTNVEARAVLRKASLIGTDISITYIPASEASVYRENPSAAPLFFADPTATTPEVSAVAVPAVPTSPLPAEDGTEADKFALPLKNQPSDSVRLASVATSPVSVSSNSEWEEIRTVRLNKEPNRSLGISIVGGRAGDGQPVQGIYIKHVLDDSQAGRTGALKTGDRILEVNGCDLRDASHDYAVAIIRNAASPVCFVVQSLSAGANMPTGVVSIITDVDDEEQVVAVTAEASEALPASSEAKEDEKEAEPGEKEHKDDEEIKENGLKVTDELQMAPLSPLKHKLSLSGSEDEGEENNDGHLLPQTEINSEYANLDGDIFIVNLTKSSKGLGISLAGNRDRSRMSVFVVGIDPDGAAAQDTRLNVADEILNINGVSVYGKSHQRASSIIKGIPRDGAVLLTVRRHPQARDQLAVAPLTPTPADKQKSLDLIRPDLTPMKADIEQPDVFSSYPNVHDIVLNKGARGLGFAIYEKQDPMGKCGIFIRDLTPGGAADEEGSICAGDHILSVDGNSLIDTKKKEAIAVMKAMEGKVSLTVSSEKLLINSEAIAENQTSVQEQEEEDVIEEEEMIVAAEVSTEQYALPLLMEELTKAGLTVDAHVEEEDGEEEGVEETKTEGEDRDEGEGEKDQMVQQEQEEDVGEANEEQEEEMDRRDEDEGEQDEEVQPTSVASQHLEPTMDVESHRDATATAAVVIEPEDTPDDPDPYTCPIHPGIQTDIIIDKGNTGLGLSIVGGTDTQLNIVVVHEVYEHRATARDGRLWPGDQLIQVNGIDLTNARHEEAISALRQSPTHVRLTVYRDHQATREAVVLMKDMETEEKRDRQDEDEYDEMLSVELKHTPGRNLGVNIVGKRSDRGVVVSMILRGGAAYAEGTLKAGDHILSINGKDVQNSTREEVAALLKATNGHVLFEIGRKKNQPAEQSNQAQVQPTTQGKPAGTAGKTVRQVELKKVPGESLGLSIAGGKGSEMGDVPLIIASINPGSQAERIKHLKVLDCIESINGQSVAGLSYANAIHLLKSSQGVIKLEVSELNPTMKDWYLKSQQVSGRGENMVAVKASVQQPAPAVTEEAGAGRVKNIKLERGPDGLGFSIVGGFGSPHGDLPIYIKTVFNKGAATVSGELKRGDQIIAVNRESLEGATHQQAVDVLKRAKGKVVITILA